VLTLALAGTVVLLPRDFVFGLYLVRRRRWAVVARLGVLALAFPYALLLVVSGSFSPFLYFQF
jgi:alginate O-acetyltransferase complex protein AlgI